MRKKILENKHICNKNCICPIHKTQLIFWPKGNAFDKQHACQDINCRHGHGMVKELEGEIISKNEYFIKDVEDRIESWKDWAEERENP